MKKKKELVHQEKHANSTHKGLGLTGTLKPGTFLAGR